MKKIILIIVLLSSLIAVSCEDKLDVNPTNKISGISIMDNANSAMMALHGIYRYMFEFGETTTGNTHQCFGPQSYSLMADVMGEDLIMTKQGSGWFWYDYVYDVKRRSHLSTWRSYDVWNFYYQLIARVNYIIAAEETMQGNKADVNKVVGQAYALRAYSYHYLAMMFSRTFNGHQTEKCVPIYREPTTSATKGEPRATVADVYSLIRSDIDIAIDLLKDATVRESNEKSQIDYQVANAFKANICLTTNEWDEAAKAAQNAQIGFSVGTSEDVVALGGVKSSFNDISKSNVMWGAEIILDQKTTNPQFMAHMDPDKDGYGSRGSGAPKVINKWLYSKLGANDIRRAWWLPNDEVPYIQAKFKFYDYSNWMADRIYLRVEEMILVEAEALCRQGKDILAQDALMKLMSKRNPNYSVTKTGTALGTLTTDETGSLLEEILIQRRLELWGEHGRVYDIKRLKQGFIRTTDMGHPSLGVNAIASLKLDNPETYDWVLTIPQAEIDANENISPTDQNPLDSGI
ncbi:MAG: RagB/SusD family nutrient uptake outer membrane protein [Prevotellaceae bacterium]|jgi:hypothetical protein|nr:RagB/SusD family nutrient uptake outer membrane protein [Prevotellaceae bacterium]